MIDLKKIKDDIDDLLEQNTQLKETLYLVTQYENLRIENSQITKKVNEALQRTT